MRRGLIVLLMATCAIPAPRAAPQLSADPDRYRGWSISGFHIEGAPNGLDGDLEGGLALSGSRTLLWTRYPPFSPAALREDIERARLFLARRGYPNARIDALFEPDIEDRAVEVTLDVAPGDAVRLDACRIEALPPRLEPPAEEILEIEEGEIFADRKVERRVRGLLEVLQNDGYARARVRTLIERPDSTSAAVRFIVSAGDQYEFGETRVRGVSPDLTEVVTRTIDIESGRRYSPRLLTEAAENLQVLDLFRRVEVLTAPAEDHTLDVIADLAERPWQSIDFGAGYWTIDGPRFTAEWKHRNLLREGRGVGLEGSYSTVEQSAALHVWKPVLFHSRTRSSIVLRGSRQSEENYRLLSGEIELGVAYRYSFRAGLRPSILFSVYDLTAKSDSAEVDADFGPNMVAVSTSWTYTGVDDRLYPTRGMFYEVFTETGFPGFEPHRNYTLIEPEWTAHARLIGPLVLATRLRAGYALPQSRAVDLLPHKRFYSGGVNSMRGYERRRLGPLDEEDKPVGGIAKLESSVELRFPILWRFFGALFFDAGEVWSRRVTIRPFEQELAGGAGLMVRTPFGPIRMDLGFPITEPPESEPEMVWHFSVGQLF